MSAAEILAEYQAGTPADTTTSVASSQNPSTYGQSVTFTATVTSGGGTPTGTVQFKIDGSNFGAPVTLSGGSATSGATSTLTVGNHTVSAVYSGDTSFNGSTGTLAGGQTVNKATPVITWANPADIVYGTALSGIQLNATASVPGSFVYSPVAGTVLNAGAGQNLHTDFTPADTANYNGASKNVTINVLKANQTIAFGALASKTYGDPPFTVSASASSGLPVSFSIVSGPATILGSTVTITGVGTVTVGASQAGNENYNPAPSVDRSFSVIITYDRLAELVKQFVTKSGIANSLLAKLDNAQKAEANGNANAKAGMIGAFINEVQAQTGKAISPENAAILINLARAL